MEYFINPKALSKIIDHSKKELVLIFKHSLTCPVSIRAYERIFEGLKNGNVKYPVYLVIVQNNRDLSNNIAQTIDITHESPQIILVKDGKAIYSASHDNIQVENIPKNIS
ncbi:MAG TPA: bacillithiol system redox-active protein YtxJ, partial [Candidatus Paceibacterota bacterium]|nr:bacillithiol system redox-active protein YtxJ [Candidatus Paceibacterota bacterium]